MRRLATHGLTAFYGDFQALFGIDLAIEPGETTALIGANGAGKSTLLKALAGLVAAEPDMITLDGEPVGGRPAHLAMASGIAMVPEGRRLFSSLSVEENLRMGLQPGRRGDWTLDRVYDAFPILAERRRQPPFTLSGGQQQMVAIGRALLACPDILLCDEISLGLAPVVIEELYRTVEGLRGSGMSVVIVEQDIARALAVADRFHCVQEGRISLSGRPGEVPQESITAAYFGMEAAA